MLLCRPTPCDEGRCALAHRYAHLHGHDVLQRRLVAALRLVVARAAARTLALARAIVRAAALLAAAVEVRDLAPQRRALPLREARLGVLFRAIPRLALTRRLHVAQRLELVCALVRLRLLPRRAPHGLHAAALSLLCAMPHARVATTHKCWASCTLQPSRMGAHRTSAHLVVVAVVHIVIRVRLDGGAGTCGTGRPRDALGLGLAGGLLALHEHLAEALLISALCTFRQLHLTLQLWQRPQPLPEQRSRGRLAPRWHRLLACLKDVVAGMHQR